MMQHTAFFGDGEKSFALTNTGITELERKTGSGIGLLYQQFVSAQFRYSDALEVIRLGLIGGGVTPQDASSLIENYAKPTPIVQIFSLAFNILEARWSGQLAINDALEQVAP